MRGSKSIMGGNNVLYVVDGMPMGNRNIAGDGGEYGRPVGGEGISVFNPDDIRVHLGASPRHSMELRQPMVLLSSIPKRGKLGHCVLISLPIYRNAHPWHYARVPKHLWLTP